MWSNWTKLSISFWKILWFERCRRAVDIRYSILSISSVLHAICKCIVVLRCEHSGVIADRDIPLLYFYHATSKAPAADAIYNYLPTSIERLPSSDPLIRETRCTADVTTCGQLQLESEEQDVEWLNCQNLKHDHFSVSSSFAQPVALLNN